MDVIVTEQGVADLRGLSPWQRATKILRHCASPVYRQDLWHYLRGASEGHVPHDLPRAFRFHQRMLETGSMLLTNHTAIPFGHPRQSHEPHGSSRELVPVLEGSLP